MFLTSFSFLTKVANFKQQDSYARYLGHVLAS